MSQWTQLIADCIDREEHLRDNERGLIDNVSRMDAEGRALSKPQSDWLDDIWERVTSEQPSTRRG